MVSMYFSVYKIYYLLTVNKNLKFSRVKIVINPHFRVDGFARETTT